MVWVIVCDILHMAGDDQIGIAFYVVCMAVYRYIIIN